MATAKLTLKRGQHAQDVTAASGSSISGSDAMELNIDATRMTKGDALLMLEQFEYYITQSKWPVPTS